MSYEVGYVVLIKAGEQAQDAGEYILLLQSGCLSGEVYLLRPVGCSLWLVRDLAIKEGRIIREKKDRLFLFCFWSPREHRVKNTLMQNIIIIKKKDDLKALTRGFMSVLLF